jgi:hypothetical protein
MRRQPLFFLDIGQEVLQLTARVLALTRRAYDMRLPVSKA